MRNNCRHERNNYQNDWILKCFLLQFLLYSFEDETWSCFLVMNYVIIYYNIIYYCLISPEEELEDFHATLALGHRDDSSTSGSAGHDLELNSSDDFDQSGSQRYHSGGNYCLLCKSQIMSVVCTGMLW